MWALLARNTFAVKIQDLDHLYECLGEAWAEIEQRQINNIVGSFRKHLKVTVEYEGKRFEYRIKKTENKFKNIMYTVLKNVSLI